MEKQDRTSCCRRAVKEPTRLKKRLSRAPKQSLDHWLLTQTAESPQASGSFHWKQEYFQKESSKKALVDLDDRDVVFYGDLDEIWNPQIEFSWNENNLYKLKQTVYMYWLNNRSNQFWQSAFFTSYRTIREHSLNELRAGNTALRTQTVDDGGWHFTFQGGEARIFQKIESYGHQEFNKKRITSKVVERLKNNQDIFGRKLEFVKDESNLPKELVEFRHKFPDWFL